MFGGFDLSSVGMGDLNKTFTDLTTNISNLTLDDIIKAGGEDSADASISLFLNNVKAPDGVNKIDDKKQDDKNEANILDSNNKKESVASSIDISELMALKENIKRQETEIQNLNQSIKEKDDIISDDKVKSSDLSKELGIIKDSLKERVIEIENLNQLLKDKDELMSNDKAKYLESTGELASLRDQLKSKDSDLLNLRNKISEQDEGMKNEKLKFTDKINEFRNKLVASEKSERNSVQVYEEYKTQRERDISELEDKIEEMKGLQEDLKAQLFQSSKPGDSSTQPSEEAQTEDVDASAVTSANFKKLEKNLKTSKNRIEKFAKKVEEITAKLKESDDKVKTAETARREMEMKITAEIEEYERKLEMKSQEIDSTMKQLSENVKAMEELQRVRDQVVSDNTSLTEKVSQANKSVEELQKLRDKMLGDNSSLTEKFFQANKSVEELQKLRDKMLVDNSSLAEKVFNANKTLEESKVLLQKEVDALTAQIRTTEGQSKDKDNVIVSLQDNFRDLNNKYLEEKTKTEEYKNSLQQKDKQFKELETNLKSVSDQFKDTSKQQSSTKSELDELRNQISNKDKLLKESEANAKTISDKLKDINQKYVDTKAQMELVKSQVQQKDSKLEESENNYRLISEKMKEMKQKFTDTKAENYNLEKTKDNRIMELTALLQSKETDSVGMKSKVEALELSILELRNEIIDKNNKITDLSRILKSAKQSVEEHRSEKENLSVELNDLKIELEKLQSEKQKLKTNLDHTAHNNSDIIESHKSQLQSLKQNYEDKLSEKQNAINTLESEINDLTSKLKAESDAAEVLEGYKKRAQVALRTANNNNSTLTAEIAELKQSLEDAQNKINGSDLIISKLTSDYNNKLIEFSALEKSHDQLASECESVKRSLLSSHSNDKEQPVVTSSPVQTPVVVVENEVNEIVLTIPSTTTTTEISLPIPTKEPVAPVTKSWAIQTAESRNNNSSGSEETANKSENSNNNNNNNNNNGVNSIFADAVTQKLESLKKELSLRGIEIDAANQELQHERAEKKSLQNRVEELLSFLERTKQLQGNSSEVAINMEYLKNCVYKFMSSTDLSEKRRLYPVIATILKLTTAEKRSVEDAIATLENQSLDNTITNIGSIATNLWSSWGSVATTATANTTATTTNVANNNQPSNSSS